MILFDDFNDNSLDSLKWIESSNVGSLVAEQNQRLEMISDVNISGFVRSTNKFIPKNTQLIIKVIQHCNDGGLKLCPTVVVSHEWDVYSENDWYNFQLISGGILSPNKKVSGGAVTQVGGDSPALTPPYWMRIRIDENYIYFDYAEQDSKPIESEWINISSESWSLGSSISTEHYCYLTAYNTPTTNELRYDNFYWYEYPEFYPLPSFKIV